MATDPDDLVAWIADLRARVARGGLDGEGEFEVDGGGRLAIGLASRIRNGPGDLGGHRGRRGPFDER